MKLRFLAVLLVLPALFQPSPTLAETEHELLTFIDIALRQSDVAYDVKDAQVSAGLDVEGAKRQFSTKIVPLTSIGFTQGTGSQKLGLEFRKAMETGASVSYGVVGDRVDEDSNYVVENSHIARAYVRVSQGLLRRWGSKYNRTDLEVAEIRGLQQELESEQQLRQLILSTANKYYALILADQILEKTEKALERSRKHLESAESRQAVGLVSKVDVYRAELAMLNSETDLQEQRRQRERAEEDFRELLRLAMDDELAVSGEIAKLVPLLPENVEEVLFDNRLDWQAYLLQNEAAKRGLYKVERDLMPDMGLSFTVEQRGDGNSIEEAGEFDETNWSLQLEMLSDLDTYNEQSAVVRKKMELSKLRRQGESLRRKISRELRDALADLQMTERRHQLNLRRLEQAGLALELAQIRYEKGLSDNLDVLDAESAYSDAQVSISQSLVAYNNAAIGLADAMGILSLDWLSSAVSLEEVN